MGDDANFDAGADDISLEDEKSVLYNYYYAVLDTKTDEKGVPMVLVKNTLAKLDWVGASEDDVEKWGDNKVHVKMVKNNLVKISSSLHQDSKRNEESDSEDDEEEKQDISHSSWLTVDEFMEKFDQIFVSKTEDMHAVILKGKFTKGYDFKFPKQNTVLSQFYYEVKIPKKATTITIGLHQEDDTCVGGHLRKNIDIGLVILEEDEKNYYLIEDYDLEIKRDRFFDITLKKGKYIIMPISTGCLIATPFLTGVESISLRLKEAYGYGKLHPYLDSTLHDIFRKVDLQCNYQLDADEIKEFGKIIDNEFMKKVLQHDFEPSPTKAQQE